MELEGGAGFAHGLTYVDGCFLEQICSVDKLEGVCVHLRVLESELSRCKVSHLVFYFLLIESHLHVTTRVDLTIQHPNVCI